MTEERNDYKLHVFSGKDGKDYDLWSLGLKKALVGKEVLEAAAKPEVNPKMKRKALSKLKPSLGDYPL